MEGPTGFPALIHDFIDAGFAKINYSKGLIEWKNGAVIHLCHCQHEKDRYNYQGAEIHVLLIDELTTFAEKVYKFLRGRCRLGALDVPEKYQARLPLIISGSNPGNIGHNWVKKAFINGCEPLEIRQMGKSEGGMTRQYIPAKLADNPTLTENDPEYADRLRGLGDPALVRAMLEGDWDIVSGGMVDDLWRRDTHVIEPFEIPMSWTIDPSFDWGSSKPFSIGWWALSDGTPATLRDGSTRTYPRGTRFRIAEWYGCVKDQSNIGLKMTAKEIAAGILERQRSAPWGHRVRPGPADSSIFDTQNGMCIADDFRAAGVTWLKADKSPGSRVNGAEKIRQMLKASLSFPMEDAGVFVFNNCHDSIEQIPVMPRDETKTDDVDTNSEDHIWDEWRYALMRKQHTTTLQELPF